MRRWARVALAAYSDLRVRSNGCAARIALGVPTMNRLLVATTLLHLLAGQAAAQLITAHRGATRDAPENTLAAFRELGVMGITTNRPAFVRQALEDRKP